ncbi:homoserine O-acetyltransferase MetX [Aurantiacibacter marinus]|uniref:Homoserine O-acetyltransferase n=1 Tax=Aurantiacibacter marinus TaxID=874156 RepID=A0A0H0XXD9_9SPHN|nr:homoserine O-acetyltransferase [Aurantiacibacter marinus]KLI64950.1 homoserine acetyltransferase [Aurantiacibacter marinus]
MAPNTAPSFRKKALPDPLPLDSGRELAGVEIAFETYGELNVDRSNAILVFHALTGDQFVASEHPVTGKQGWWERMVGPGKPIDTARYYVICANVLGSCMGSTGPASPDADGKPYAKQFPVITIRDMVRAQMRLLDVLGIETLHAVVGGSMGGMQALSCAANFPERTNRVLAIATTARHSAQNIAFHEVGRQAIMADPDWQGGAYYGSNTPDKGLSVARMAAHITYLSEAGLTEKFGRRLQDRDEKSFGFDADFQVESYLRHQGISFTDRFDANSYLYITRAMDYFDLAEEHGGRLANAFRAASDTRFCLVSFDTDWLYTTADMREIVHALNAVAAPVSFVELSAPYGHDSFLLDVPALDRVVKGFIG